MYETTMTVVGRVATAVSQLTFDDGGVKATFRLASTERRFDRGLQQWVDGSRLFLTVICWRVLAERVLASLGIGDPVIVSGILRTREYEKDGRTQTAIELTAASLGPDLLRCSAVVARRGAPPSVGEHGPQPGHGSVPTAPASSTTTPMTSGTGSADAVAADWRRTDEIDDGTDTTDTADWNGGPLVREYLDRDDHAPGPELWPNEAAVRA